MHPLLIEKGENKGKASAFPFLIKQYIAFFRYSSVLSCCVDLRIEQLPPHAEQFPWQEEQSKHRLLPCFFLAIAQAITPPTTDTAAIKISTSIGSMSYTAFLRLFQRRIPTVTSIAANAQGNTAHQAVPMV